MSTQSVMGHHRRLSKLESRLRRACFGLGINLIEITQLVKISDLPEVACWGHDKHNRQEAIYINPKTLKLPIPMIQLILRHEVLHAAGYERIGGARDHQLSNLVLDIAINFVLKQSDARMLALSKQIYPKETAQTLLALVQCHLKPPHIQENKLKSMWIDVWHKREVPNTTSWYYRILMESPNFREALMALIHLNPFGEKENGEISLRKKPGKADDQQDEKGQSDSPLERMARKIAEDLSDQLRKSGQSIADSFSQMKSELFDDLTITARQTPIDHIRQLISRLKIRHQLDEATRQITEAMDPRISAQPYPTRPSKRSLIYAACGYVPRLIPLWWNLRPEHARPRLAVYVDTSPSMNGFKESEVYVIDQLRGVFPTKIFLFAGSVEETDLDSFAQGKYRAGYSTSFDAVIEHFLDKTEEEACIIFTDGESSVTSENAERFRSSRRRLFAIYFSEQDAPVESTLDDLAEQTAQIVAGWSTPSPRS